MGEFEVFLVKSLIKHNIFRRTAVIVNEIVTSIREITGSTRRSIVTFLEAIKNNVLILVWVLSGKISLELSAVVHVNDIFKLHRRALSWQKVYEDKVQALFKALFKGFARDFVFHSKLRFRGLD